MAIVLSTLVGELHIRINCVRAGGDALPYTATVRSELGRNLACTQGAASVSGDRFGHHVGTEGRPRNPHRDTGSHTLRGVHGRGEKACDEVPVVRLLRGSLGWLGGEASPGD